MSLPVVAIVGRPNVGKSSLFNWLAGRRIAIVDPTAGVTRDRVSTLLQAGERYFELIDTGGVGIVDADDLSDHVERQIQIAIDQAHLVLHVVDGREGVAPLDEEVAARLRGINKPVVLLANKCDAPELDAHAADLYRLGEGRVWCVSAQQNRGKDDILRLIARHLPPAEELEPPKEVALKLAIVGRRNTGKSTFINALAQDERMIVSEVAGTTRDSVDVRFERDGKAFVAIDTAGVRRHKSLANDLEFYSLKRAERSIRRADVVLLFLDAAAKISKVDKQLAEYILEQHKPAVFVVNKWDLLKASLPTGKMADYVKKTFPSLDHVPIAFITAKEGKNVFAVLNLAQALFKQSSARVTTGDLNRVLRQALEKSPPPMRMNRRAKVYYATQVAANPPTIVLFTNGPELFDNTYLRYLVNTFRDELPFHEVAINLQLRAKRREEGEPEEGVVPADADAPPEKKKPRPRRPAKRGGAKGGASGLWQDV